MDVEELRVRERLIFVARVFLRMLDAHRQAVEVPRHPDRGAVARGKHHLPALARMETVRRVVDPADGAPEAVGVGLRVETGLERVTRNRLVCR